MGLLDGRKGVIFGVANEKSIAWAIARALHAEGAELAFTYAGEVLEKRVRPLAEGLGSKLILPCDVTQDDQIQKVTDTIKKEWGGFDILIHSIAFANRDDLKGDYLNVSREGFRLALDVSAYSLTALTRHVLPLMEGRSASIITLTYLGGERVVPGYNVMGVAKAALDASVRYLALDLGPRGIRTEASRGGFDILIHSIAFANRDDLKGDYLNVSREGFRLALDVSAYSLTALTRHVLPLMEGRSASIITLTYLGGERVVPGYNVMGVAKAALDASVRYLALDLGPRGIRINAISAGPIRTLASSGISGFKDMLHHVEEKAPLRRNVSNDDVAKTAIYLASELSVGVTGELIYVDAGYNIMGM